MKATLYRTPPLKPITVDDLAAVTSDPNEHVVACLADGGHRYPDDQGGWKQLDPLPDPHFPRPSSVPLLADGIDFAGWTRKYGTDSVKPVALPANLQHLVEQAMAQVREDSACLNLDAAIEAAVALETLCEQVHYIADLHADEHPGTVCVFDAPSQRFYLLIQPGRRWPAA